MAVQTEWLEKDYYKVLGVAETACDKDIQRAYRRLARKHHPDANPDDPSAEDRFKEVSAAYDVLGDADKRKEYDEVRRLGPVAVGGGAGRPPGDGAAGFRIEDLGDLGDLGGLFGNFFGSGAPGAGPRRPATMRGTDLEAELQLGFEQAVFGLTTEVHLAGEAVSTTKVRIPAGVTDGQLIRIPGRGGPGRNGGPPGDLFVHVRVAPHPRFGRRGHDLTVTVPVTYPQAVLGGEVEVPTLDGPPVTVRVPPGTPSGRTLRVKGHGVPRPSGSRGDLLVAVEVAVPRNPSPAERTAVEALAKAMDARSRADAGV